MIRIKPETKIIPLINSIIAADVVIVDDHRYLITKKDTDLEEYPLAELFARKEDFESVFETPFHEFTFWEIREDSKQINQREWEIGNNIVSFYSIQPV